MTAQQQQQEQDTKYEKHKRKQSQIQTFLKNILHSSKNISPPTITNDQLLVAI